jgi:hypothetical protein
MANRRPRYSKEEHARRGEEIYQLQIRPQVEAGNQGKIVAIDVDTAAFEMGENVVTASERLLARYPDAQIWCVRIGHRAVHRFGLLSAAESA